MHSGVCACILELLSVFMCVHREKGNSVCWYVFVCLYVCLMCVCVICFVGEHILKS